jgi:hypothetical protein
MSDSSTDTDGTELTEEPPEPKPERDGTRNQTSDDGSDSAIGDSIVIFTNTVHPDTATPELPTLTLNYTQSMKEAKNWETHMVGAEVSPGIYDAMSTGWVFHSPASFSVVEFPHSEKIVVDVREEHESLVEVLEKTQDGVYIRLDLGWGVHGDFDGSLRVIPHASDYPFELIQTRFDCDDDSPSDMDCVLYVEKGVNIDEGEIVAQVVPELDGYEARTKPMSDNEVENYERDLRRRRVYPNEYGANRPYTSFTIHTK